jgi:16S rRNA (adenine1518-N6/adenine1519-N6)-dimethyltransferase
MKKKPRLGQNFLVDEAACIRIADALGDVRERTVLEIGPGHGAITAILVQRCGRLHCVEFDPALARELTFRFRSDPHVTIHHADILQTNVAALCKESGAENLDVAGNLPYYITSDILLHLFAAAREGVLRRAVLMTQREVAERITAQPGAREYAALSALTQMHARAASLFTLPPAAFSPQPEVYSSVMRLDFALRFAELQVDPDGFNLFLRASFAQKRKTLRNNLRAAGFAPEKVNASWPPALPEQVRAEAVSLEQMATLYRALGAPPAATAVTESGS